ncbi:MAG: glycoside hydrolase TIM-barrel-like domain-containing protein [Pseudomonadota bacterium]
MPAVDKGTNAPNVFVDPKSSESALPFYSNGTRDDLIQRRALAVALPWWQSQPFVEQVLVWAWDGRPWPDFPAREDVWSDGSNWQYGHWLNGRTSLVELADLVSDLGREATISLDVSGLTGVVDGYSVDGVTSLASALAPLTLAYDFHVRESDSGLIAQNNLYGSGIALDQDRLVEASQRDTHALLQLKPNGAALTYIAADFSYQPALVTHRDPSADHDQVLRSALPLLLTEGRARLLASTIYQHARATHFRRIRMAPGAAFELEVADPVKFDGQDWRVEQIADSLLVRDIVLRTQTLPVISASAIEIPDPGAPAAYPADIEVRFLDIAGLSDSAATGPTLAVTGAPWLSPIDVKVGATLQSLQSKATIRTPAWIGQSLTELPAGTAGDWDEDTELEVHIPNADLSSADPAAVLDGVNRLVIARAGGWEVIGFRSAILTGANQWRLSGLLRGMLETDVLAVRAEATIVIVNDRLRSISLAPYQIGVPLFWQFGSQEAVTYTYSP